MLIFGAAEMNAQQLEINYKSNYPSDYIISLRLQRLTRRSNSIPTIDDTHH